MNLNELAQVLSDFGCQSVDVHNMNGPYDVSLFRSLCKEIFSKHHMDIDGAIICNYDLWALDTGIESGLHGHLSPIAAYHEDSDRVLLLDTFCGKMWVKVQSLYNAMNKRGYIAARGIPVWNERKEQELDVVTMENEYFEGTGHGNNNL